MTSKTLVASLSGCASLTPYEKAIAGLPNEDFLIYRGRRVHVEERGSGPPMLLLHGFAASTYSFHKIMTRLEDHFRVVALDYYGFGYTERPKLPDDFGVESQLDLIRHVMDVKKLGCSNVLGQSYGGTLALLLAQTEPCRCARLVLVSAMTEFGAPPCWLRNSLGRGAGYLATRFLLSSQERFRSVLGRAYYRKEVLTAEVADAYRRRLLVEGLKETYFAFASAMGSGNSPTVELSKIKTPALVVAGRHDEIVPPGQMKRLSKALPSARLVILESSGHSSPEEEPAALAKSIHEFAEVRPADRP